MHRATNVRVLKHRTKSGGGRSVSVAAENTRVKCYAGRAPASSARGPLQCA
jgi:hypothetical protein